MSKSEKNGKRGRPRAALVHTDFKSWKDTNPLREWRGKKNVKVVTAALQLTRSMQTIFNWESGVSIPDQESIETIAKVMRINPSTLARNWQKWLDGRPQIAA